MFIESYMMTSTISVRFILLYETEIITWFLSKNRIFI